MGGMGIAQWESHGNGNWLQNWEWEWEGMGTDCMGMGGNGNVYSHSRPVSFSLDVPVISDILVQKIILVRLLV